MPAPYTNKRSCLAGLRPFIVGVDLGLAFLLVVGVAIA